MPDNVKPATDEELKQHRKLASREMQSTIVRLDAAEARVKELEESLRSVLKDIRFV